MRRRVKITGIGPVTPAGIGREAFFAGINEPVSRIRMLHSVRDESGPLIGADILDFDLQEFAPEESPRRLSRHTQFGLVAAILALDDAGISRDAAYAMNSVVVTGSAVMDIDKIGRGVEVVSRRGPKFSVASTISETSTINVAAKISEYLGSRPRMFALQSACCSGLDAIGQAAELIANCQAELAIAGGSEAPLTLHPLLEFSAAELSPTNCSNPEKACRPFDLWRSVGVMGEGACMLTLEPESSPRPAIAWVTGYGYATDPDIRAGFGIAEAGRMALANARRRPAEVDYINAWAPGHKAIDLYEAHALRATYQPEELRRTPVTSIKGAVGSALGAAGAIQAASVALSLRHGVLPPTVNWETEDPSCRFCLSSRPRYLAPTVAVVNSHGISGTNACLVLEKSCPC